MRARWSLLALALALSQPLEAAAQGKDAAASTALFQQGREAAKRGDYATAIVKMQESYRLDPAIGTLLNLADAHAHLGHTATAYKLFTQAHGELSASDDRRPAVKQRITALEPRLPRLTVSLAPGAPSDARAARDGVALAASDLGVAIPVDPGSHVVTVTATGREERRYVVDAVEQRAETLVVEPGSDLIPNDRSPRGSRNAKLRIAGFAVGGAGLASLGVAIATGLMLPAKQKTVNGHCGEVAGLPENECDKTGFDAAKQGKQLAGINTVAWIAGGVAVATGATLVIIGSVSSDKPAAALDLHVAPGFAGATLGGRF